MSETKAFIDEFYKSEFAKKNVFSHLQAGIPIPIAYKEGLGMRILLHGIACNEEQITFFAPKFEVRAVYPDSRIFFFTELEEDANEPDSIVFGTNKLHAFKYLFESSYAACDEVLSFYNSHNKVTPIVLKKYYELVEKSCEELGIKQWYGGLE